VSPKGFGRIAGLACLFVLLLATACHAQMTDGKQETRTEWRNNMVAWLATLKGVTFCREVASISFVAVGLSAIDLAEVSAHERKHAEQHRRFKSCAAFQKYYNTPAGKMKTEVEAFAAGWCVATAMGADPVSLRAMVVQLVERHYVPGTPVFEISQEFKKYEGCGKP
jgi:hypothetical protein